MLAELKAASGNEKVERLLCNLSRLADVRRAADEFKRGHDRLDVLVNNAGATFRSLQARPAEETHELTARHSGAWFVRGPAGDFASRETELIAASVATLVEGGLVGRVKQVLG